MASEQEMRPKFVETLIDIAKHNSQLVLINSDSQKVSGTAAFAQAFPERCFNVGIAEANMVGVAAGMNAMHKIPVVNSFTSFMTRRCFDQITISIAYAGLSAIFVGSNPGISSELNGGTHMSFEDIGIMRTIPRMVIVEPCDTVELEAALKAVVTLNAPVYLRLFRGMAPVIHTDGKYFKIGKGEALRQGSDITLIGSGLTVNRCLKAADILKGKNVNAQVINIHTIKPIDAELICQAARETGKIVTVDNHSIIGSLGSAVAEVVTSMNHPVQVKRLGVQDRFGEVGKMPYLEKVFGIAPDNIAQEAINMLQEH